MVCIFAGIVSLEAVPFLFGLQGEVKMKKFAGIIVLLVLFLTCFVFVACTNIGNETVTDAVTISNLKSEVGVALEKLTYSTDLLIDSERGVVSFTVENSVAEITMSEITLSSGSIAATSSEGDALTVLTLNEGLNTYILNATSGTITVTYTLKITRKAVVSTDPVTDPEPDHVHTYADSWSKDENYHWHAATCEHTTEVKDKAAHIWNAGEITIPAMEDSEGEKTYTCTICGATKTEAINKLSHIHAFGDWESYTDATCTAKGEERRYCTCGDHESRETEIDPDNHELIHYGAQEPTCTKVGWASYDTCSRCHYSTYAEIAVKGHNYDDIVTAPTCIKKGYTIHTCSRCADTYTDNEISALGHDYDAWTNYTVATCVAKGEDRCYCSRCDAYGSREIEVDPDAHDIVHHNAQDATCTEFGWEDYDSCLRCNYTTYVERPAAHIGEWVMLSPATCTSGGIETRTCFRCSAFERRSLPAFGHSYGEWEITSTPTCTKNGSKRKTCVTCSDVVVESISKLGHSGEWIVTVVPTCTGGEKSFSCTRCDETLTEKLPIDYTKHVWSEEKCLLCGEHVASEGLQYELLSNETIQICGYTGNSDTLYLPSCVAGSVVTSIKDNAFKDHLEIKNVFAPRSITSAGANAFEGCNIEYACIYAELFDALKSKCHYIDLKLESSYFPYGTSCSGYVNIILGKNVNLPYFGNGFSRVISIVFPDTISTIERIYGCSGLTTITIPSSLTRIEDGAFMNCTALNTVYYTGDIAGWVSISGLEALTRDREIDLYISGVKVEGDVTIPDNVIDIGDYAFSRIGLTSVTIPASVMSIGDYTFFQCHELTDVTLHGGVKSIGMHAFVGCIGLTSFTIPDSVTSIGASAFHYCNNLSTITIPDSVTNIGTHAFSYCSSLKSATIGRGVSSIGDTWFMNCVELISITFGNNVTCIEKDAFYGCYDLSTIYYTGDISDWCAISGLFCLMRDYYTPTSKSLYIHGVRIEGNLVIPDSVTSIGDYAFFNCAGLTSVMIPSSVTSIGNNAFSKCNELSDVMFFGGVTTIGAYAFSNCPSLTEVALSNGIASIGRDAFSGCSGLISVSIPDSVTSIGEGIFRNCSGLTSIFFQGTKAQWSVIAKYCSDSTTGNYTVTCTDGVLSK